MTSWVCCPRGPPSANKAVDSALRSVRDPNMSHGPPLYAVLPLWAVVSEYVGASPVAWHPPTGDTAQRELSQRVALPQQRVKMRTIGSGLEQYSDRVVYFCDEVLDRSMRVGQVVHRADGLAKVQASESG